MSEDDPATSGRAIDLQRAFDQTFAAPPRANGEALENLLGLRVGSEQVLVRLAEVRALLPEPKIVPLPSTTPGLLGLAGLRGTIVPIYALGALLGHAPSSEALRSVILVGTGAPLGLAFEEFVGHLRVSAAEIAGTDRGTSRAHVKETARVAGRLREIISVSSVIRAIEERMGGTGTLEET